MPDDGEKLATRKDRKRLTVNRLISDWIAGGKVNAAIRLLLHVYGQRLIEISAEASDDRVEERVAHILRAILSGDVKLPDSSLLVDELIVVWLKINSRESRENATMLLIDAYMVKLDQYLSAGIRKWSSR
jgi:hypothetical protein